MNLTVGLVFTDCDRLEMASCHIKMNWKFDFDFDSDSDSDSYFDSYISIPVSVSVSTMSSSSPSTSSSVNQYRTRCYSHDHCLQLVGVHGIVLMRVANTNRFSRVR